MRVFPIAFLVLSCLLPLSSQAQALEFVPCPDASEPSLQGSVCSAVALPLAYGQAGPEGLAEARVTIFVRKFPAHGTPKGAVWLIAGGPGESGASLYPFLPALRRSFPGLDLLIPDHRGTGQSSRLCPAEESVGSPGGTALSGAEWGSCFGRLNAQPELARQFTITHAALDLRHLAASTARDLPTYIYGVSYGTQLVLRAFQLGPLPVAGVVLDSLVPPETDGRWDLSRRSQLVDEVGRQVLAECDASEACRQVMGGSAEAAYRQLLAQAVARPDILAEVPGKSLPLFFGGLLDEPSLRARIPVLIKDISAGRNERLRATLADFRAIEKRLFAYPQSPSSLPLVGMISSSENNLRPALTAAELKEEDAGRLFKSRLPELLLTPGLPRYPRDQHFGASPSGLPPTLVLAGTLDPKTAYQGAVAHVGILQRKGNPVSLVAVEGAPHFILWTAPDCFEQQTRAFLERRSATASRCSL